MYTFNPIVNSNPDDTDVTMINHSLLYGGIDEPVNSCIPIVRRVQQANQSALSKPINTDNKPEFVYIDHDPLQASKQIEQILNFYRQELKQESNTQLDCNRQLITRLVDFVRPAYSSDRQKMKDLDVLYTEIFDSQHKRFVEEKEKNVQLTNQLRHLKNSIISTPIEDNDRNSLMTNIHRMNTMFDYEERIELEEETKKLLHLVETQREQIDKLIELLSQTDDRTDSPIEITNNENHVTPTNSLSLPTRELPNNRTKECPVCNYEYPVTFSELEITNHVERCVPKSDIVDNNIPVESKQLVCPCCNKNLSSDDDIKYLEHVSECFNDITLDF